METMRLVICPSNGSTPTWANRAGGTKDKPTKWRCTRCGSETHDSAKKGIL